MSAEDDELLEYEAERDDDENGVPVQQIAPVPVHVCEPVVTVETVPQHMTASTFVVSTTNADQAIQQILPQDPLRVRAVVIVHDQPVIICHSRSSANASANTASGTPQPSGGYVQADPTTPSPPIPFYGVQEVWAAATYGEPARVTVFSYRRSS
jgi:hypothetical protein